jgi:hypothetical protein
MLDSHAIALAASEGISALNAFIETRFELADEIEATEPEAAAEMREIWTHVWEVLADAPTRAVTAELHEDPAHIKDPVLHALAPVA